MKRMLAMLLALTLLCAVAFAEGGTDAAERFEGAWSAGEAYSLVIQEENGVFICAVGRQDGPQASTLWEYECAFDGATGELTNPGTGIKTAYMFDENGAVAAYEQQYDDGAARFALSADGSLIWLDAVEGSGEGMAFVRADGDEDSDAEEDADSEEDADPEEDADSEEDEDFEEEEDPEADIDFEEDAEDDFDGESDEDLEETDEYEEDPLGFEDVWVSDGASLDIFRMDESYICIVWMEDGETSTRWVYEGCLYDEASGALISPATGVKTVFVNQGGVTLSEEDAYDDGEASFALAEDGFLTWTDRKQDGMPAMRFERIDDDEADEESEDGLHASIQRETDSPDWVKALPQAQDENVTQLFIVAGFGMDKTSATISMHERDEDGEWKKILSTPGLVGRNGLCADADHAEGCGQTPIGVYRFNRAFGIAEDPGTELDYVQVDASHYWSGDDREGMRYNELVTLSEAPELNTEASEHLIDYEYEYQYCLNISFNEEGAPGRGSAIFLHCLGTQKPYTGGCVAIPENIMKQVLLRVSEDCVVVIDTMEALDVSF